MMEKQPPKQIYLQAYESNSYDDNTWCQNKINDEDIEYILQSEYDQLKAENDKLVEALQSMFDACMKADEQGELSELISGELLDSVGKLLGYTPENAIKKEREYLEAIKQALKEVKE